MSAIEETVCGTPKFEVLAQGRAAVPRPAKTSVLKLEDHWIDEDAEPLWTTGEHDAEAIAGLRVKPGFHYIGDGRGGADESHAG
jgi:hypothetical protein